MSLSIEFCSDAFRPLPGEEAQTNPGRYGKALADFLAAALSDRGVPIAGIAAEDWGWRVDVRNADFALWIGCGNVEDEEGRFLCFVEPSARAAGSWFRRKDTRPATEKLAQALFEILSNHPDVEHVAWSD